MRSSFSSRSGFVLVKSPSYRQQAARRRFAIIGAAVGLALGSWVLGSLTAPKGDALSRDGATGPFSYFPHS